MSFVDTLIPRLKAAGLTVTDIRNQLPRNGTWMMRPINQIKRIAVHYDADFRPKAYDSLARYKSQAQYHINKDWGGGAHGDGLMYAIKVDNVGDVFMCRNFEEVTWHVGDPNYTAVGVCFDCGGDQAPTREQIETFDKLFDVLTTKCPEFPAERGQVYGHQEFKQFGGTATACPGQFMPEVVNYRNTGNTRPQLYTYDYPPTTPSAPIAAANPAPVQSTPEPTPQPVQEQTPMPDPKDAELSDLRSKNSSLQDRVNELTEATNKKDADIGSLNSKIAGLQSDISNMNLQSKEMSDQIIELHKQLEQPKGGVVLVPSTEDEKPSSSAKSSTLYLTMLAHFVSLITASGLLVNTGNPIMDGVSQVVGIVALILTQMGYNANAAKVKVAQAVVKTDAPSS